MLPDLGPRPGRDTLLHLEAGQQNQPVNPPRNTFPACPPRLSSRFDERLERSGARQAGQAILRIALLLQDHSPDPHILENIRERIIAARLLTAARLKGLLHANQCGSLPGLRTYEACLTLTNDVKTLQRPRLKVSPLFLDMRAGFDNVDKNTLAPILREGGIPPYLVSWVSSFLGERSCTLVFQGAPGTPAPVNVGAPEGSPISPLLFLLYVAPLHFSVPGGLMISYVDDFTLAVVSLSYRGNIRRLQELFERFEKTASRLAVFFSVAKTELIHWRTPSQRNSPKCISPIQIKAEVFRPSNSVRWLGYWFTPALDPAAHFSRRLALAQGAFALIRGVSPPGAGLPPYLCHRLASSLVAPILLYGADLFTPGVGTTTRLDTFRRKVQRWTTNCFSARPTGILSVESCLPPVSLLIAHRQRLAALRVVCSPPTVNTATARRHPSFTSLSEYRAPDCSRALTRGLSSVYLPLHSKSPRPVPPMRNHLPVDAVAHRTIPFTLGLSRMPMINSHLVHPTPALPPQSLMDSPYSALKKGYGRNSSKSGPPSSLLRDTTCTLPPCPLGPSWAWANSSPGESTR